MGSSGFQNLLDAHVGCIVMNIPALISTFQATYGVVNSNKIKCQSQKSIAIEKNNSKDEWPSESAGQPVSRYDLLAREILHL